MGFEEDTGSSKLNRMTRKAIELLSKKNKLYMTPHLNDVLYLHYQGYEKIECLEEYTGVKCLWLECNAFSEIRGLENQTELRCLYLQNNLIKKIENLGQCRRLDTLNLSHNYVTRIENCGVDVLPELNTLNLSHNSLKSAESLENLIDCRMVSVLDLSNNRINDILIVKVLARMPELRVLVLTGNPVVNDIPSYRKSLINECKRLTYLDQKPVSARDRACAEAWKRGGYDEEKRELTKWNKRERKKVLNSVRATIALRRGVTNDELKMLSSSDSEGEDGGSRLPHNEIKRSNELENGNDDSVECCILNDDNIQKCQKCCSADCNFSSHAQQTTGADELVEIDRGAGDFPAGRAEMCSEETGYMFAKNICQAKPDDSSAGDSSTSANLCGPNASQLAQVKCNPDNMNMISPLSALNSNNNCDVSAGTLLDIASNENITSIFKFIDDEKGVSEEPDQMNDAVSSVDGKIKLIEIINDQKDMPDIDNPFSVEHPLEMPSQNDGLYGSKCDFNPNFSMGSNNNNLSSINEHEQKPRSTMHLNKLENISENPESASDVNNITIDLPSNRLTTSEDNGTIEIDADMQNDVQKSVKMSKPSVTYYCMDLSNLCENPLDDQNDANTMETVRIFDVSSDDENSI